MNQVSDPSSIASEERTETVLLVTTCWWPVLARFAHLLSVAGCRVAVLCPPGHSVRCVPGVQVFAQSALRPMHALARAIAACNPSMIVPSDDRAVADLHQLHRDGTEPVRRLIERSLGHPDGYPITTSRVKLLDLARQVGLPTPDGQGLANAGGLDAWMTRYPGPWVLKVAGAWGGMGVRIAHTPAAARAAYEELRTQLNPLAAVKRAVVNGDPFWIADVRRHAPEISIQAHIHGQPGNLAMFCRDGEVLATNVVEALVCKGETGPSSLVRLVERPDFVAGARRLAGALRLSGFHGLDFMVEPGTGRALLIELNARPTPLSNLRLNAGRDIVGAAVTALRGLPCPTPAAQPAGDLVAHFPLSWQWNQHDPRLADAFQDVPWDAPALMAEMLRPSWPERLWLARLAAAYSRRKRDPAGTPDTSQAGVPGI